MTRVPVAGQVKTRLIPVLGSRGATELHAALLRETFHTTGLLSRQSEMQVEVRFTGGSTFPVHEYQADHVSIWREQQGTDLGDRMSQAIGQAMGEGASAVIVIGSDCPDLSPELLNRAWELLYRHEVVLGPAVDDGYCLIGMKQPAPELFTGIEWGTAHVLRQTRERCHKLGKSFACLPTLGDVDEPEDLVICRRMQRGFAECLPQECAGLLSVVIPTLNEVGQLESTVKRILETPDCQPQG